jgi:hypothetical protein
MAVPRKDKSPPPPVPQPITFPAPDWEQEERERREHEERAHHEEDPPVRRARESGDRFRNACGIGEAEKGREPA